MFCPKCGNQLPDAAKFCTKCGEQLEKRVAAQTSDSGVDHPSQNADTHDSVSPRSLDKDLTDATKPAKKRGGKRIAIVVLVVLLVGALVFVGYSTRLFGLADRGVWKLTKMYSGDVLLEEMSYDAEGRVVHKMAYEDSYPTSYDYNYSDDDDCTSQSTMIWALDGNDWHFSSKERNDYTLASDGRVLASQQYKSVTSESSKNQELKVVDLHFAFEYRSNGTLDHIESDSDDRYEYDDHGFLKLLQLPDSDNKLYFDLNYDMFGKLCGFTSGEQKFSCDTDFFGNITAIYNDKGECLRRFEYQYFDNAKIWEARHESVYLGISAWGSL